MNQMERSKSGPNQELEGQKGEDTPVGSWADQVRTPESGRCFIGRGVTQVAGPTVRGDPMGFRPGLPKTKHSLHLPGYVQIRKTNDFCNEQDFQ